MKRLPIFAVVAFAMFFVIAGGHAAPQGKHRATLSGVVVGPGGKPVANAVVTYQSGGGDTPHVVRTDAQGRFSIPKLRRDNYDLRASAQGMFSNWEKNVMLHSGEQKSVTLRLTTGADVSKTAMKPAQR
jgi:hypothetical protein